MRKVIDIQKISDDIQKSLLPDLLAEFEKTSKKSDSMTAIQTLAEAMFIFKEYNEKFTVTLLQKVIDESKD